MNAPISRQALTARAAPSSMPAFEGKPFEGMTLAKVDEYRRMFDALMHIAGQAATVREAEIAVDGSELLPDTEMVRVYCARGIEKIYRLMGRCIGERWSRGGAPIECKPSAVKEVRALHVDCARALGLQ